MASEFREIQPRHMMATFAENKAGDLSRNAPDLAYIHGESETEWLGNWVFGFGFINVRFPKATTRELTPDEVEHWESQVECHSNGLRFPVKILHGVAEETRR